MVLWDVDLLISVAKLLVFSFVLGIPLTHISLFVKAGLFRSSTSTTGSFTYHHVLLETSCARLVIIFLDLEWLHGSVGRAYPLCPCRAVRHGFEPRTIPHTFYRFYFSYFNFRIILFLIYLMYYVFAKFQVRFVSLYYNKQRIWKVQEYRHII